MVQILGFRIWGLWFRVQGSGFRVQGSGFGVQGSGFGDDVTESPMVARSFTIRWNSAADMLTLFWDQDLGFGVWVLDFGFGVWVLGFGFGVWALGFGLYGLGFSHEG